MREVGAALLELAAASRREFVMCAPFAKEDVVTRVLDHVEGGIEPILYTRWRPEEIAAGVTDTGVLGVLQSRGGQVFLHDRLHAKYFRNEDNVLIGSANLTAKALGWTAGANLELLVPAAYAEVDQLERRLQREAIAATEDLADEMNTIAALLPERREGAEAVDTLWPEQSHRDVVWVPRLRFPQDLYVAYSRGPASMSRESGIAAEIDLAELDIPAGLEQEQFRAIVRSRLRHNPLLRRLDDFLRTPRRFGEVRGWIGDVLDLDRERATTTWQTVMRWLLEYFPERYSYEVHRHSEVFGRAEVGD